MSGLVVDVTELIARPGATLGIQREVPVPGLRGALGWIGEDEPVIVRTGGELKCSISEPVVVSSAFRS